MAQPALERWVCTENIAKYRARLNDPAEEIHFVQIEGLLARELARLQALFAGQEGG